VFDPFLKRPRGESVLERALAPLLTEVATRPVEQRLDLVTAGGRPVGPNGRSVLFELGPGWSHGSAPADPQAAAAELARPAREATEAPSPADQAVALRAQRIEARMVAGAQQLASAREAQVALARAAAQRARAVAAFAATRPSSLDRPDDEIGAAAAATRAARPAVLTAVSEWAVDELAVALSMTGSAAGRLLAESLRLDQQLPATLAALEEGRICWEHAQVMTEVVACLPDAVRPEAEARLLGRVAGRTPSQLRAAARRVAARLDAAGVAQRMAQAIRDRRVSVYPGTDGMATLATVLPVPVARAVESALEQYAEQACVDGDERGKAQRMADCLVDLVVRPGDHGLAPVQANLTMVAPVGTLLGGNEPGEINGDLIPAEMVRQLAITLGLIPADDPAAPEPVCHANEPADGAAGEPAVGSTTGTGTSEKTAADSRRPADGRLADPGTDRSAAEAPSATAAARSGLADLLRIGRWARTALGHRPRIAIIDDLRGQLLALTDSAGLRGGRPLGPPPGASGYRPGRALDRFVRARDRRCRFPGCRAPAARCDLDHTVPWPRGSTTAANLCCLCRHHHRLSHQAPGWQLRGLVDGGLEWTTPTGQVLTTHPPAYGTDDAGFGTDQPTEHAAAEDPPPF
jgi:Domain of unknown function (DUF222)